MSVALRQAQGVGRVLPVCIGKKVEVMHVVPEMVLFMHIVYSTLWLW